MSTPVQPGLETTIESPNPQGNGAQSPVPSPAAFQHGATGERMFSAEELQKARQQEKDKLYAELDSMKASLKAMEDARNAELAEADRRKREKESALKAKKEDEMSAKALLEQKLKETNDQWEDRFSAIQAERELERAQIAKEKAYNELVDYRNSQLNDNAEDIAPEFHPFITGESREQIDNAIAQAKLQTQSMLGQIEAARQKQMSQMRGVSTTGYASLGPLDSLNGPKQETPEQIANMPMSEYAVWRQKNGIAARDQQINRGLFG